MPPNTELRRRRRSSSSGLAKAALYGGATLALAGVAALFIGQAMLESYLKSEAFRLKTAAAIGRAIHADTRLSSLQRSGTSLFSDNLDADGNPDAQFASLRVEGARAELDLTGLWKRLWKVDSIIAQRLDLRLADAGRGNPHPDAPAETGAPVSPKPHWLAAFLPNRTEIGLLKAERAHVSAGPLEASQVRLDARPVQGGWDVSAQGGEIRLPNTPPLPLNSARLAVRPDGVILQDARLLLPAGGQANVEAEWKAAPPAGEASTPGAAPAAQSARKVQGRVRLENAAITPFLPAWWQTRLHGNANGEITFHAGGTDAPEWSGQIRLSDARLEALPILSQLDSFLGSPRFREVPLRTATARIRQKGARTEIRDLELEAASLLKIQGTLVIDNGQLNGDLQVGLFASLVQWLPAARVRLFGETRDGYVWAPLHLSGTVDHPVDDLSARLVANLKDGVLDAANNLPKSLPNALPKALPPLPDAAQGAVDALKSLLPNR